jgi:hypothetical protein
MQIGRLCVGCGGAYFFPQGQVSQLSSLSHAITGIGLVYKAYYTKVQIIPNAWPIDGFLIQAGNASILGTFQPPPQSAMC